MSINKTSRLVLLEQLQVFPHHCVLVTEKVRIWSFYTSYTCKPFIRTHNITHRLHYDLFDTLNKTLIIHTINKSRRAPMSSDFVYFMQLNIYSLKKEIFSYLQWENNIICKTFFDFVTVLKFKIRYLIIIKHMKNSSTNKK